MSRPRFAILGSGRGSNAERLMEAFATSVTDADLALVVSDVPGAPILDRAQRRGHATAVVDGPKPAQEAALLATLAEAGVGHLLLGGYLRILSPDFLRRFGGTVLNIHPSILPAFPGLDAPARQWEAGVAVAGATVHFVDEGVDTGPILLQGRIAVRGDEGPQGLADRILIEVEHRIYPRALRLLIDQVAMEAAGAAAEPAQEAQAQEQEEREPRSLRSMLRSAEMPRLQKPYLSGGETWISATSGRK